MLADGREAFLDGVARSKPDHPPAPLGAGHHSDVLRLHVRQLDQPAGTADRRRARCDGHPAGPAAADGRPADRSAGRRGGAPATAVLAAKDISAKRSACQRAVDVLSGATEDASVLTSPEVRLLAKQAPDLVICGAVRRDSDAPCNKLLGKDRLQEIDCLSMRSTSTRSRRLRRAEASCSTTSSSPSARRAAPASPSRFPHRTACRRHAQCDALGDYAYLCRAFITMDPKVCSTRTAKGEGPDCEKVIERNALYAKGLEGIAASGGLRDRELAKAAMGINLACAALAQTAMDTCAASLQPPPGNRPGTSRPARRRCRR